MRLDSAELGKLLGVLEKIDRGEIRPRATGRIGRFLRQYGAGRAEIHAALRRSGIESRGDNAVSGSRLGPVELCPLLEPKVELRSVPVGEVADTPAISEELGGLSNVVMWLSGRAANKAYNRLRVDPSGLRLVGDFRWTPPSRLTPGEARVEACEHTTDWTTARCIKAVADDLGRSPHALEYVLDYRLGPPGMKYGSPGIDVDTVRAGFFA
jgi:hypothetical protein